MKKGWWKKPTAVVVLGLGLRSLAHRYRASLEREELCAAAQAVGEQPLDVRHRPYHITVFSSLFSGRGENRELFQKEVAPIMHLAGVAYDVVETAHAGDAKERAAIIDLSKTDGVVVLGGDGLAQEVLTGLLRRADTAVVDRIPFGIIPMGTANIAANALHTHASRTQTRLVGEAALAIVQHRTRRVDVMSISRPDTEQSIYALSLFGAGLPGAIAERGHAWHWARDARYTLAGLKSLLLDWPVHGDGTMSLCVDVSSPPPVAPPVALPSLPRKGFGLSSFLSTGLGFFGTSAVAPPEHAAPAPTSCVWIDRAVQTPGLVISTVAALGPHWPLLRAPLNDGLLTVALLPAAATAMDLARLHFHLRGGTPLTECPGVETLRVRELTYRPAPGAYAAVNVDGEAMPSAPEVHVRLLPRRLTMFAASAMSES